MKSSLNQIFSRTLRTGLLGWAAFAVLAGGSTLWAGTEPGYSHDSGVHTSRLQLKNWMAYIPDTFKLSYLSLPGTHDSMSRNGGDIVQTQSMDLQTQLDSGIRVLDIRLKFSSNSFSLSHGGVDQPGTFESVLDTSISFLQAHPSEVILMRVKKEEDSNNSTRTFDQVFNDYWTGSRGPHFWNGTGGNPTLGEMRGKMVVLRDFTSSISYGINYKSFKNQDDYTLNDNWDLYNKWTEVKDQLSTSRAIGFINVAGGGMISAPESNKDLLFMNYLSGSTGAFPYFVASGKSSHETGAPQLLTGMTTIITKGWPDFPRVGCLFGICSIAFEGTNNLTYNWLDNNYARRIGVIMADFPGAGLVDRIIEINYLLVQYGF